MNRTTRFAALLVALALQYREATAVDYLRQADVLSQEEESEISRRNDTVPQYDQEIRGGFEVTDVIPWYLVFADTTICGGALIYKDIAITAAHCVQNDFPNALRIGSLARTSGGTTVSVARGVIHPSWTGSITNGADVAVMKLSTSVTNEVATINTDRSSPVPGNNLFIAGFGLVDDSKLSSSLRGVFLEYVSSCSSRIDSYNSNYHLCGDSTPSKGTCAGDSGSPVAMANSNTIVGLNSYSDDSCESQTIDVYTRVSSYSSWVDQQICALSSNPPASCGDGSGGGADGNDDSNTDDGLGFYCVLGIILDWLGWN